MFALSELVASLLSLCYFDGLFFLFAFFSGHRYEHSVHFRIKVFPIQKMPLKKREWVRSFEIGPATSSLKSKVVLYQVTSLIFPVGFPEAATKLVVRKKFSDFQQLHKALSEIHKNLYLKGKFPVLPKFNKGYFKSSENAGSIRLHQFELKLQFVLN